LPVGNGGTGISSYTSGDIIYATGATTLTKLGIGSANQVLAVSGGAPTWTTLSTLETDPEVNMSTTNAVPKWNGTQLVNGSISDDGTTVSVGSNFSVTMASGNTTTNGNLTVNGNTTLGNLNSDALTINATSTFAAAVNFPVTTVNGNTTLGNSHFLVLVNASGGAVTITLPSASTNTGRMYVIMKIDNSANTVTIQASGSDNINGGTSLTISSQWGKYTLMSAGGTQWVAW